MGIKKITTLEEAAEAINSGKQMFAEEYDNQYYFSVYYMDKNNIQFVCYTNDKTRESASVEPVKIVDYPRLKIDDVIKIFRKDFGSKDVVAVTNTDFEYMINTRHKELDIMAKHQFDEKEEQIGESTNKDSLIMQALIVALASNGWSVYKEHDKLEQLLDKTKYIFDKVSNKDKIQEIADKFIEFDKTEKILTDIGFKRETRITGKYDEPGTPGLKPEIKTI